MEETRPASARGPLECPCCQISMQCKTQEGADVHECGKCGGLWVDFIEEKTLLKIKPETFTVDELRRLRKLYEPLGQTEPVRYLKCPVCGELMYRKNWGARSGVIVDKCGEHGTWYDRGEVDKIREYVELGGIEYEKLKLTEDGLNRADRKLAQQALRLDRKIDSAYMRARWWSMLGF
jgi:Zn-finger nucleic acid-binding protein